MTTPYPPRITVTCINWNRPDAPHAAVWIKDAPNGWDTSLYFATHPEAITYAQLLARRLDSRMQRHLDDQPCPHCGGDRLRPDFTRNDRCHAPRETP